MACEDHLSFKSIDNIGDTLLMSELEGNLKLWFDWAMLGIGAWTDVDIPTSGAFGGDFSILRSVDDDSYTDGQVWQGNRKDWVWETGVNYVVPNETGSIDTIVWTPTGHQITLNDGSDIAQSGDLLRVAGQTGVSFNTDYYLRSVNTTTSFISDNSVPPTGSGNGGTWQLLKNPQHTPTININSVAETDFYVDYPLGRVVLNTAVSTSSTVTSSYSYRYVQVYRADSAPWWNALQFRSLRPDDIQFVQTDIAGEWEIGGQHRIQLPAIVLEAVPQGSSMGYQLGDSSQIISQDVLFHTIAESRHERNQLVDVCRLQNDKVIWLYSTDNTADATGFPLDHRGMRVGTKMYPNLVDTAGNGGYRWKMCDFTNVVVSNIETPHTQLYAGVVRMTMRINMAVL